MKIIYIHGANASERSFAFIQQSLDYDNRHYCNYTSNCPASHNTNKFIQELKQSNDEFFIIAHSLGGIYSIYLYEEFGDRVRGAVTLSTPYGGSEIAYWAQFMNPRYRLFKDITPNSNFIGNTRKIEIQIPWTQVVTTMGSVPWLPGDNDGIVTIDSMKSRSDMRFVEIDRNHYEIVQSARVVDLIKRELYAALS